MNLKHGHNKVGGRTLEYGVWARMHQRCNNPNDVNYNAYGKRGIKVCTRWNDFASFIKDMGLKPTKEHSLDRIDNNGNYEPSNCRWATRSEQANNRRFPQRYRRHPGFIERI